MRKSSARRTKKSSVLDGNEPKLTKVETEVLCLLTDEFLTARQISIRRGTSPRAARKVIQKLKEKGVINPALKKVPQKLSTSEPSGTNSIRLHGQEFNIKILYKDKRYESKIGKVIFEDGNTVRLYKNSIEIYSGHDFYADDVQKATFKSLQYWQHFFARLENSIKVILIKPRYENIRLVNAHYSEINNELARDCNVKAERIRVYTTDDSKLWFRIDNSFNLNEAETVHPQTSKEDMGDVVKPFFNDLRDKKSPLPSEVWLILSEVAKHERESAAAIHSFALFMKSQLPKEKQENITEDRPDYIG